jgi:hypothetical protein
MSSSSCCPFTDNENDLVTITASEGEQRHHHELVLQEQHHHQLYYADYTEDIKKYTVSRKDTVESLQFQEKVDNFIENLNALDTMDTPGSLENPQWQEVKKTKKRKKNHLRRRVCKRSDVSKERLGSNVCESGS